MSEFSLIDAIQAACRSARRDVALGIGDDAALLDVPSGRQLVACTDTLVAGVHFPAATGAADIGWKSLAVNLSDLAAMGATPAWALLALTLPDGDPRFVDRLIAGFLELARAHDVALVGGDTTEGPLSVTVTALGLVPPGSALMRGGARAGDAIFATGTLGDAAGALSLSVPPRAGEGATGGWGKLRLRLDRPEPRIAAGVALRGVANGCIDVSDGLLADLGHVCKASGVGAELELAALPLSAELVAACGEDASRRFALTGGDDYELCFTAPEADAARVAAALAGVGLRVTRIGSVVAGAGVIVRNDRGVPIDPPRAGWEHFSG